MAKAGFEDRTVLLQKAKLLPVLLVLDGEWVMGTQWYNNDDRHLQIDPLPVHVLVPHHSEWDPSSLVLPCLCVILLLLEELNCPECLGKLAHRIACHCTWEEVRTPSPRQYQRKPKY